jgi:type II secretory ATPase GspE/PulE/Tfp pilus assembly ATPase PilB-like protein
MKKFDEKSLKEPTEILEKLLEKALESGASDMHLEPGPNESSVRLRIDGVLHKFGTLDKYLHEKFIGALKVVSEMDITKKRVPQDGSYHIGRGDKTINFRISTYPTIYGEAVVMRILDNSKTVLKLRDLGFNEKQYQQMTDLIRTPYGILLVTGPTGSGKTSLQYAILSELKKPEVNVMSIEDPVEYIIDDVRQTNVSENSELTFAQAIKGTLRQDPDIIMIGEIRDSITAEIAFQAALSGKFVLSTFHTFSIMSLVSRLMEMGIPQSIISASLIGVVSTRLVRTICQDCKVVYDLTENEKRYFQNLPENLVFYRGTGCEKCHNTGYRGRTGIFNVVPFDDEINLFLAGKHTEQELLELYSKKDIKTLEESAMDKILSGQTTVEEVYRVLGSATSTKKLDDKSLLF